MFYSRQRTASGQVGLTVSAYVLCPKLFHTVVSGPCMHAGPCIVRLSHHFSGTMLEMLVPRELDAVQSILVSTPTTQSRTTAACVGRQADAGGSALGLFVCGHWGDELGRTFGRDELQLSCCTGLAHWQTVCCIPHACHVSLYLTTHMSHVPYVKLSYQEVCLTHE